MAETVKNVLIVEDNEYNMLYLVEVMSMYNFNLICASTGKEAVEKASSSKLDLVLMDVKLPELGGYEAAKEIRKLQPNVVIVAQTAYMIDPEVEQGGNPFSDYLIKPINKEQISRIVERYLTK
ncbi:MAG: response regulator [Bacteroidales bacterium]|nr:response regulator [Bacteroidales bacterium]